MIAGEQEKQMTGILNSMLSSDPAFVSKYKLEKMAAMGKPKEKAAWISKNSKIPELKEFTNSYKLLPFVRTGAHYILNVFAPLNLIDKVGRCFNMLFPSHQEDIDNVTEVHVNLFSLPSLCKVQRKLTC